MSSRIDIYFTVSKNSVSYANYAKSCYLNLCSDMNRISFMYYCLDKVSFRRLKSKGIEALYLGDFAGSHGHSIAIDAALAAFDSNHINIISDTDVAVVVERWDEKVESVLREHKIDIFGTQLEKVGGFSSGISKFQQYKAKPSTTWLAFRQGVEVNGLTTCPNKESTLAINTPELSDIYGLPLGFELVRDTGWQIPMFIAKNRLSYQVLDLVKPTEDRSRVLSNLSPYHDEFHLSDEPFLVHQRGSMTHLFQRDKLSKDFYGAVDKYLNFPVWSVKRNWNDIWDSLPVMARRWTVKQYKKLMIIWSKRKFFRISQK